MRNKGLVDLGAYEVKYHSADRLPLLAAQHGVWVAQQLDPSNPRYNCGGYLDVRGTVDRELFERAVNLAISETEALRVRFIEDEEGIWQVIEPPREYPVQIIDMSDEQDPGRSADAWMRSDLATPLDLGHDPLFIHVLFKLSPDHYLFYFRYHHIVMDGYGQSIYWKKIAEIYSALANNQQYDALAPGRLEQLVKSEADYLASEKYKNDRKKWLDEFSDRPDTARLSAMPSKAARGLLRRITKLESPVTDKIKYLADQAKTRWSTIVTAAWVAYMYRVTGIEDVILSFPVTSRTSAIALNTPCMLANELPLRFHVDSGMNLQQLVKQVTNQVSRVLKHQQYRGEELHREMKQAGMEQRLSGPMLNIISFDHEISFAGKETTAHYLSTGPITDLLIGFYGNADGSKIQVYFDADPELYTASDISGHNRRFLSFLDSFVNKGLDDVLKGVELLLPGERQKILEEFNATDRPYDLSKCLHELVDEQAQRTPDAIAISVSDRDMSYRELVEKSDWLADLLHKQGVKSGQYVGVCDVRSLELVIELLAILKAGAAYIPLDTELPVSRINFQVQDAGISTILSRSSFQDKLAETGTNVIAVDEILPSSTTPVKKPSWLATPESPAYVIYTSGSTGQPKGVVVPHRGVVNRLLWMQDEYALGSDDCVLQKTPFTFDVSVWEFFWPLITGSRLFLAAPGVHRDPRSLAKIIQDQSVTTVHFVPPMLDLFLAEPEARSVTGLRRVICSGEALRPETVRKFFDIFKPETHAIELHNLYGPTEASIDVTYWQCLADNVTSVIPIGRPVANTRIYLLDRDLQPVPIGVPGELCIAGVQVACGYLNRDGLSKEKFVPNPFGNGQMYRTGDLARYRDDGAIEFLGRFDHQIKIRGFRIELGEVESALLSHGAVQQTVVLAWERDKSDRRLVAYVVGKKDKVPTQDELTTFLAGRLPEYMIPAHIIMLNELPLSPNGKINRHALPEVEYVQGATELPSTTEEKVLYQIWREVLGVNEFGIDDSFFTLGGDSMLSIRVRAAMEREGYTFDIQDLFRCQNVRELAKHLTPYKTGPQADAENKAFSLLENNDLARLPAGLEDAFPLSSMQRGMLYQSELEADSSVYRVVTSLHLNMGYDKSALNRAIHETFQRHPALRSSFDLSSYSVPLQLIHAQVNVRIDELDDLSRLDGSAQQQAVRDWMDKAKFHRFNMDEPPLIVFAVHRRGAESFQLSVIEHHVVLDGWSDVLMLEEIVTRYKAKMSGEELWLPKIPSAYRDFIAEERRVIASEASRLFWSERLHGVETAALPRKILSNSRPNDSVYRQFDVSIKDETIRQLQLISQNESISLKALLILAHMLVLRSVCNSDDVTTGVVFNGRLEKEGADEVIGVFLNTLPLYADMRGGTLMSLAHHVFDSESEAIPHGRYPFAQMQQDTGEHLQLDSYVNYMDFHREWHKDGSNGDVIQDAIGIAETNFPLAVNFMVDPLHGYLRLWLDCNITVLDSDLCERLAGYYQRALNVIADLPDADVAEIDLIDRRELDAISGWNNTAFAYDKTATIHGQIEKQAAEHPSATALAHRWQEINYKELDSRANQLARQLREQGVKRGDLVGVSLRRDINLVVALFAVLKSGGAYVPLDPGFPRSRLEFIVRDAGIQYLITNSTGPGGIEVEHKILLDRDDALISAQPMTPLQSEVTGDDPAYVIYTSGSTGLPKGTVIRHRNVLNFFHGMDNRIGCSANDVVLALTSVSFDISVLELLWPLARGAKIVVASEQLIKNLVHDNAVPATELDFSLFFFGAATGDDQRQEGYSLVMDAARFADANGFEAIWTPERHFHEFGGLYPNPSVLSAALASITKRVQLRCGSVVAPLHDSIRIAEEWSLVDNLSGGRVGLAFASGWNANDFVLAPDAYHERKNNMNRQLEEFMTLWQGGTLTRVNGRGDEVDVRIYPSPVQEQPPIWFTSSGAAGTFEIAGATGVNLLTHLLGQDINELADKIRLYRAAWEKHGHKGSGRVTVMVHTFVLDDDEEAKQKARTPFREYLRTSTGLLGMLTSSMGLELPDNMTQDDIESVLDLAVDRYFERSGIFGSPATALNIIQSLAEIGVDEVACLIDFGVQKDEVVNSLTSLNSLRQLHINEVADSEHSFVKLCQRHKISLIQGTPSFMSAVAAEPAALGAMQDVRAVLVGGEIFPSGLAERLMVNLPKVQIYNMYGPTETTIWSTVHKLDKHKDVKTNLIPIGSPIVNTEIFILNQKGQQVPVGVEGELWIGGDGVAGTYLGRPELTAERFVEYPQNSGKLAYRTGDRARWRSDGLLEFLGRIDRQVKILGHRIEPDEVESVLSRHPQVGSVAVVALARETGQTELVAYVSPGKQLVNRGVEDAHVKQWSDVWEDAYTNSETGVKAGVPERDFAGWLSSYTNEPIPPAEMLEWLQHTIYRIIALRHSSIIDVGVGVGLVLRELLPNVNSYLGIDISKAALDNAKSIAARYGNQKQQVEFVQDDASYLETIVSDTGDTIILNSVIQYFPGVDYLDYILNESIRVAGEQGAVFIGDVRSFELLETFHTSVQFYRAQPLTTVNELNTSIARQLAAERELCLSTSFFRKLGEESKTLGEVRIELKRGHAVNELTCFRYDVTLLGKGYTDSRVSNESMPWTDLPDGPVLTDTLGELLNKTNPQAVLTITGIPNRRLVKPLALERLLKQSPDTMTAWELERQLWEIDDTHAVNPEEIAEAAERLGWKAHLLVPAHGRLDEFDAVFEIMEHAVPKRNHELANEIELAGKTVEEVEYE